MLAQWFSKLLLLLAIAGVEVNVSAQGTNAQLPDPIDSRTITRILERYVQPTVPQWIEIENMHEAYLERFAKLRNEDIERFLKYMRETMGGVPDSRTTKELLRQLDRLRSKIKIEDERLFNEIAEYLDEDQLVGLARVRRIRERVRLTSGFAAPDATDRSIDIWTLLDRWDNELPPDVLARVDSALANYEERVIPLLRSWRKAQEAMMLALVDELQASGIGELSVENATPEELQKALEAFQLAYANAQANSRKAADALAQLNERTIKSLESLAGPEHGRDLRMAYWDLLSNGRVVHDPGKLERIVWRLLDIEELAEETRDLVLATRRTYRTLDDRYAAELLALALEVQAIQIQADPADFKVAEIEESMQSIQEYIAVRKDLAERLRDELRVKLVGLGDPTLLAIVDSGGARSPRDRVQVQAQSEDLPPGDPGRGGPTDFIPRAISKRDLETIRANLDPEPWQQAILSTIYDDYLDMWRQEVEPTANACRQAQASIYRVDPERQQAFMDGEALRRSYAHAKDAASRIEAVDAMFFSNLSAPISESQQGTLERLRVARSLDLFLRGTDPIFSPMEVSFRRPNIFSHLEKLELTTEEKDRVNLLLGTRSDSILDAARVARDVRFDTELRIHELNQRMSQKLASGAIGSTEYGIAYRKLSDEMAQKYGEQIREWKLIEEEFQRDLMRLLDAENARLFAQSWKRESNPTVYRDPNEAGNPLRQALEIDDLTGEQIGAIASILAEYEVSWEQLSDEMAGVREKIKEFGALSGPETYDDFRVLEQRYKQLEFEREETNLRALRRLALYLSPEQRVRIRALQRLEE